MYTEEKIEVVDMKKQHNALFEAGKYAKASQREFNAPIAHSQPLPHYLNKEWELKVQHETILAVRVNQQGRVELFINRQNFPECENPWELTIEIQDSEDFSLGGIGSFETYGDAICINHLKIEAKGLGTALWDLGDMATLQVLLPHPFSRFETQEEDFPQQ